VLKRIHLILTVLVSLSVVGTSHADDDIWRFGFYWSITAKNYPPNSVPWAKYTHISQIAILPSANCEIDAKTYMAEQIQQDLVRTARSNHVKILITLLQDKALTAIARCTDSDHIAAFADRIAAYVTHNNYDGVDIDWEFGVVPGQYQNLVRELRRKLPHAILTADIAVHQRNFIAQVQDQLDRINLMNYDLHQTDYHGAPLRATWHQAALKSTVDHSAFKSGQANVNYLLSAKIAPSKINFGVPFYGYAIAPCKDGHPNALNCAETNLLPAQPIDPRAVTTTQVTYAQIAKYLSTGGVEWDEASKASYIRFRAPQRPSCAESFCKRDSFVTFSSPRAVSEAVNYLLATRLGGIMTFALHQEFLSDQPGDDQYPLSSAIYSRLSSAGRL
jgi:GH18 family chitinase